MATVSSVQRRFLHAKVAYFSQWESPELAKAILEKSMTTDADPQWRRSGATSKREYRDWSWAGCGMACTKMLLAYKTDKIVPLVTPGKKCAAYGGYTMPLKDSVGLLYKPYITFVQQEFGWQARIATNMPLTQIIYLLARQEFVIASVNPAIRHPKSTPKTKGGHLILLLGYDLHKKELYFHNPSGISKQTQAYAAISFTNFEKFFSGRGIVVT